MEKKITVIGGDLRSVKLIESLAQDGFKVFVFGVEKAENLKEIENVVECNSLVSAIESTEIIVGPIPLSSNPNIINTPFSDVTISIDELGKALGNKQFIAGSINEQLKQKFSSLNVNVIDLLEREELAVLNTISTAEGAIQIAIEQTLTTLHGSNVLVLGFGRIGKILSKMLNGIGAKVSCEARKNADLAWIKAYGYNPIHLNELDKNLEKFNIIINTVPFVLLDEKKLSLIKEDCLIIDLASNPGGVDREVANKKKIKVIWALSLPGKVAPITSAEFIKETIYNILKERS